MDKRFVNPTLYTGQSFVSTRNNFPNFASFTNQAPAYYPPYTYAQYSSGYPCQDFYYNNYGHHMQEGYVPFHVQSVPNPSSYTPSYSEVQGLYQNNQNITAFRPPREPICENSARPSRLTPSSVQHKADNKSSTLDYESVPNSEKVVDAKPKKKRKKPKKKTDSSLDEAKTEIQEPNKTTTEVQAQKSAQNLECALDSEKSNTTAVSHQQLHSMGNKPGIPPVRIYSKPDSTIVKANYNVDFPSLDAKSPSDVQVSQNTSTTCGTTQPSFAEKLKKPKENVSNEKEAETPFLDWRDQRTKDRKATQGKKPVSANRKTEIVDVKISSTSQSHVPQTVTEASQSSEEVKKNGPSEEFVMQKGKRGPASSKRSSEISQSQSPQVANVSVSQSVEVEVQTDKKAKDPLSPEARAKLQAKRKAKREQQKEEKKRVREQKLLHEKLAAKDQKVRIITSELMGHYNKPVQNPRPENYISVSLQDFPSLEHSSKPDRAESPIPGPSSYSAALQRVMGPINDKEAEPVPPASSLAASKKLKRRDPIEFNLFATAITKSQLKAAKQERRKNVYLRNKVQKSRERTGVKVVANPLDSSAPSFSRGKIRQKKKRLTYVEKAQLREKLRKQAVTKMMSENWDPNDTNLDVLISVLGSKLTSHGRLRMKEELEAILALYNTQRSQDSTPLTPKNHAQGAQLHSRRFRDYCDQLLKDEIDDLLTHLLLELHRFQDRAYNLDPIKAKSKRRLVLGLKEVTKQVERKRVKIVILVPDIQACPGTGGLDEAVARLLDAARSQGLPIVYGLSRRKLGRLLKKKVPASCCGILNYQSMEETFRKLWGLVEQARSEYEAKYQQLYGPKEDEHDMITENSEVEKGDSVLVENLCQRVQSVLL